VGGEPEPEESSPDEADDDDAGEAAPEPEAGAEAPEAPTPVEAADDEEARQWLARHAPKLTRAQAKALNVYAGTDSYEINSALRTGEALDAELAAVVRALDSAMSPLPEPVVLFRGLRSGKSTFPDGIPEAGQVITDAGYGSTSAAPAYRDNWPGKVVMEIVAPEGTPALLAGGSGAVLNPAEREVILARGTQMRVVSRAQVDGQWRLKLEVVQQVAKAALVMRPSPGGKGDTLADRMSDAVYTVVGG
jgi:hypothetical protein